MGWFARLGAIGVVSLVAVLPALIGGQPFTDSGVYDEVWTSQFAELLVRGEIYPHWLPRSFGGFGAPTFYFYPPLAFYLTSAIRLAGVSVDQAVTLAEGVICFLSGASMLVWLRARDVIWPLLWACVYAVAPYRMIDLHLRGDVAELGAFVWLPLICLASDKRSWPLMAIAYGALILTHLPMAILAGVFVIAPLALADRSSLATVAIGCTIGVALSAIYLLPALALQPFIDTKLLWTPYYTAANWSLVHPGAGVNRTYLYGFAVAAISGGVALWLAKPHWGWWVIAGLTAICGLGLAPIWSLPVLRDVQFPWRVFGLFEFAVIAALAEWRVSPRFLAPLAAAVAFLPGTMLLVNGARVSYASHPSAAAVARGDDAPEYLPPTARVTGLNGQRRTVDPRTIGTPPLRAQIAQAARLPELVGAVLSTAAALAIMLSLFNRSAGRPDLVP